MIKESNFLQNMLLFLVVLVGFNFFNHLQAQEKRPNILLIMTDQHQGDALGVNGNEYVKTPNLDNLAESGMNFNRAYVSFPLCTPSRSSIFTGKMPHSLEVNSNEAKEKTMPKKEQAKSLGFVLNEAGYHTAYGGKWHVPEPEMVEGKAFKNCSLWRYRSC